MNYPVVVMDFCAGGDLHTKLSTEPTIMCNTKIVHLVHDVLKALLHLHSNAVIHRDVELANIPFDHGQKALLGDMGIAILVSRTRTAARPGTPGWVAPEYWPDRGQAYGTKIDVFSASLVMACVGQGSTVPTTLEPDESVHWLDDTPPWLKELHEHTHQRNPIQRWSSQRACQMMSAVVPVQERDMVHDLAPPLRSEGSESSGVSGAGQN